jgi:hypothetical protein
MLRNAVVTSNNFASVCFSFIWCILKHKYITIFLLCRPLLITPSFWLMETERLLLIIRVFLALT